MGGSDLYEWLPTRFRISASGERYEIGVRREDIEGLLELTKTIGKIPLPVETVLTFWNEPSDEKFTAHEEVEWIFMGVNIEPTIDGFQKEYGPLLCAYTLALRATIEEQTYDQLIQNEWQAMIARYAIDPGTQRTVIFGQLDHVFEHADTCGSGVRSEPNIAAKNLAELPLVDNIMVLKFAPGKVKLKCEVLERKDILVDAFNGRPEITIMSSQTRYDDSTHDWISDGIRVIFQIPPDTSVRTFKDMQNLKVAKIGIYRLGISEERVVPVQVNVEDDRLFIRTEDELFSFEIETPKCDGCGIPNWKFPRETPEHVFELSEGALFGQNISLEINRFITNFEKPPKTYCADCIVAATTAYLEQQEYANEDYARQRVEAELRDMGYEDVELYRGERGWVTNGWSFETGIEYTRDNRSVTRFTGEATLGDSGNFTSSLQPREFVLFRYIR